MILFPTPSLKTKARGMYSGCLLFFLLCLPLGTGFAQTSDTKEIDKALREELGLPSSEDKNNLTPKTAKTETNPITKEESNPVQDRYLEKESDAPSATWILTKIIFVLGILLGFGYFIAQKLVKSRDLKFPLKGFMRVLSTLSLSPGQSVQIVEVGQRIFILGAAEGSINLISEITNPEEKSQIQKAKENFDPYQPNFLELVLESLASARKKIRVDKQNLGMDSLPNLEDWKAKNQESLDRIRQNRKILEEGSS